MPTQRHKLPDYLRRSLLVLIIFLMGVSIARLLVTMHQQDERIEILEGAVAQLMADTSRLQLQPGNKWSSDRRSYHRRPSSTAKPSAQHTSVPNRPSTAALSQPSALDCQESGSQADIPAAPQPHDAASARTHKFTSPHIFDLNTIDSLTLIRIPGIASRTAAVILEHRQRYGGFHSPEQLRDFLTWDAALAYIDEWCTQWFTADAQRIRPIALNVASISELQRHPYITHQQAVELVNYRTRHKRIASATELQQLSSFTPEQLNHLLPYLSFE